MKTMVRAVAVLSTCLLALPVFGAVPVRINSHNGTDSIAQLWNLFGPTQVVSLKKGTTTVNYKQQVVCINQDETNASDPSNTLHDGACDGDSTGTQYLFLFQLRSSATNVTVQLSGLSGFTPTTTNDPNPTYGVMLCDPSNTNTLELCTTATQDQLPAIIQSANPAHTTATFVIPNFPKFPNGLKHQGQGLTIFVLTKQTASNPISLPVITLP
jgi:hypothetical protein